MGLFRRKKEKREITLSDPLLIALLSQDRITSNDALNIPTFSGCVELISNTIAMIPIKLYREEGGKVNPITDDVRVRLLNDDTKDTLDGHQFKKALITDYLINGAGYAYINKERNNIKSLHYVEHSQIAVNKNADPIFKKYEILCHGQTYRDFEFLKLTRKTKDGVTGIGIIEESQKILSVAYNSLVYENVLVKTGGNKKGFLKSENKLSQPELDALKEAWNRLYANNTENIVILNKGLDFKEASNTSVEMQLNENKKTNAIEICKLFPIPPTMLEGKATEEEYNNCVKVTILPILYAFQTALNKDLLLEKEKESFYFAFDTKELLKGDMKKRYEAYEIAIRNGFMQIDDIRYLEDFEPFGLDFIKLGLQDVLYNPKTKEIYTPNTNKTSNIDKPNKEVIQDEGGNKE